MQPDNMPIRLPGGLSMPPFGIHQYLAVVIVAIALWATGSLWLGLQATGQWLGSWQQQMVLHVYLDQHKHEKLEPLQQQLSQIEGVTEVIAVNQQQSAQWMQAWMGDSQLDIKQLAARLPDTLEVHLDSMAEGDFISDDIKDVSGRAGATVNSDEIHLLGMREVLDKVESLAWFVTLLLALAMALIISNTLRMILLARADEVHLMRLMGAKEWFVRLPFVLEGMLLGVASGLLAWLLLWPWLWGSSGWLADSVIELHVGVLFLPLLLGGALLGGLGAFLATASLVSPDSME
ncbi:MAG: permease-like cell division protein FtsX [Mariprofundaceae bacterium]